MESQVCENVENGSSSVDILKHMSVSDRGFIAVRRYTIRLRPHPSDGRYSSLTARPVARSIVSYEPAEDSDYALV